MFVDSNAYKSVVEGILRGKGDADLAVAFWGQGAEAVLPQCGKKIRILCNFSTGGTNPDVIIQLMGWPNIDVRHRPDLHAKVIICGNKALVGSANMSTNGLNIEDAEFGSWQEAGYQVRVANEVSVMKDWFSKQWSGGEKIGEALIKTARTNWAKRRINRVATPARTTSLQSMDISDWSDRDVTVAIHREFLSPEARTSLVARKKLEDDVLVTRGWDVFENWRKNDLRKNSVVLSVYVGSKGAVRVDGPLEVFEFASVYRKGKSGDKMNLHYTRRLPELLGERPAKFISILERKIRASSKRDFLYDGYGCTLPMDKFLQLIEWIPV